MNVREVLSEIDLRGQLVRLRPPRLEDAEHLYGLIAGRREILDWIEWAGPKSAEDFREQARHWRKESDDAANYQLAIASAAAGGKETIVGAISLRFIDHPDRCDIGYWIAVEEHGRGFASEAVGLAAWVAFEVLGARSMSACAFVGNDASRRVLEKHGFETLEQQGGCATTCDGRARWNFRLERETWAARASAPRPRQFHFAFTPARP